MKKLTFLLAFFTLTSCSELQNLVNTAVPLTNTDIGNGLKEALTIGISNGSDALSKLDGFYKSPYKILLPAEARKVTDKLKFVPGFEKVEEVIVEKLNRAAEDAAVKAKPIFVNAIKGITFNDVMSILMGEQNAATQYLNNQTYSALYDSFQPEILESLNKFNAVEYWAKAVTAYNKIPFINKVNPKLDDYVTNEALGGLFSMVEKEELGIRTDISKRTSDLMRRVFAKQDKT